MIASDNEGNFELSRRKLLAALGLTTIAATLIGTGDAEAAPVVRVASDPVTMPPVHGLHLQFGADALTPIPAATATELIDTTKGTVHMVIGGGGTSAPSNQLLFNPPACRVITAVGAPDAATGKRPPIYVKEDAPWSAVRNAARSYGFAAFTLDPGARGGYTTITVTYYDVVGSDGALAPFETFTLRRPRRD